MPAPGDGSEDTAAHGHEQDQDQLPDPLVYATGTAAAATPTPTPPTAPHEPPVRTDTRMDDPLPPRPASTEDPSIRYTAPVDPWADSAAHPAEAAQMAQAAQVAEAAQMAQAAHVAEAAQMAEAAPPVRAGHDAEPPTTVTPPVAPSSPAGPPAGGTSGSTYAAHQPRAGTTSYKKGFWVLGGAAVAAAVALGIAATILLGPGFRALDYHELDRVAHFPPVAAISSTWAATQVRGDRAYFASVDEQGTAGVVAADTGTRKELWRSTEAGTAHSWHSMTALPDAVALVADPDYSTSQSTGRLVVLDGRTGHKRWEHAFGSSDTMLFRAGILLLVDRTDGNLIGLDLTTGTERWRDANPDGSANSTVLDVTTPDGLTGPATNDGFPVADDAGDGRIVQVAGDRSARIVDLATGKVGKTRSNVAYSSDKMVAHHGRLFVEESATDRLVAYDLKNFDTAEPAVLHTARNGAEVTDLTPCGDDRICFVETAGYQRDKAEAVAYDLTAHKETWRRPAPQAETLVPVGDAVLVTTGKSTTLLGADGKAQWTDEPGDAVRLDAGNVLRFSDTLSPSVDDRILTGVHLGDQPALIGRLRDVRSSTCSWNRSVIACAGDKDYLIARFAG
ncbi:Synaptojanin-2 [Actinoplanes sp. SE50]|uniref:outer membrane protein assembly factor BamB family protein n=1 Tax=unclassified Actinoplanes TaxID=2626549 RepID=UPI00023EDF89|nr:MULTISPECIES: PQQ-binding-like beta-propeller repeat protein [unclassified Actinoplanes]AEV88891.1 Synaptojanin-2 [Actinoplanes sp. SE50/110]ATO87297.1 Synaptojanin-2 [Actinoplanes sp. SE50]SLM04715.1 hypothetical protein ACSP50_8022 [Actinoplanes sp. SE50/110]